VIATGLISCLALLVLFIGIKGSARFCRVMSFTNISTIVFICIAGSISVRGTNWSNFAPKGFNGVLKGAGRVFFAYIGFENSTTLATEVKDPKRYMPGGVMMTLVTAISLYMLSSLIITGMIPFYEIDAKTPFFSAFYDIDMMWAATIVGIGSLLCMVATTLTILVGLPRIIFQMSRDGLLWDIFSRLNRFRVPFMGTIIFGFIACIVSFVDLPDLSDLISFGVLLNYSLMNMGVISLRFLDTERKMSNRQILVLVATICSCIIVGLALRCPYSYIVAPLSLIPFFFCLYFIYWMMPISSLANPPVDSFLTPYVPFLPCIGTLLNIVLLVQLGLRPFWQVSVWLAIGSCVYFLYGMRHSRLNFVKSTDQFYY